MVTSPRGGNCIIWVGWNETHARFLLLRDWNWEEQRDTSKLNPSPFIDVCSSNKGIKLRNGNFIRPIHWQGWLNKLRNRCTTLYNYWSITYTSVFSYLHIFILLINFCGCFKWWSGGSILWEGNRVQWGTNWAESSWSCFLLWSFSWLWLCNFTTSLIAQKSLLRTFRLNLKEPQSINSKTVDLMAERTAADCRAPCQQLPWVRKSIWHTCNTKYMIMLLPHN